jgi:hypothetical protein
LVMKGGRMIAETAPARTVLAGEEIRFTR